MLCRAEGNMLQGPSHNSIKINGIKACYHIIFIGETESLFFMGIYRNGYTYALRWLYKTVAFREVDVYKWSLYVL